MQWATVHSGLLIHTLSIGKIFYFPAKIPI